MAIKKKSLLKNFTGGFSLPELMVTIGIIVLITAVILVRYANFNSSVLLSSQAFEIGLDLREAQVFGLGVRGEGSGKAFREEYGVYFDTTTSVSRGKYIFFQDDDAANGEYDPARYDAGEELNELLLDARHQIISICVSEPTLNGTCQVNDKRDDLSVTFKRPNFDARFYSSSGSVSQAYISVSPIDSDTEIRTVKITSTGQIEVL